MYGDGQLKIMFVSGGNVRKDYHIEEGEEIFYMYRGNMNLPVIEQGKPKTVQIMEGEWLHLPRLIPHSPQRPEQNSMGLVMERERLKDELDCLRYYTDDYKQILYEETFHCTDLGTQLPPVMKRYFASEQHKTGKPVKGHPNNPEKPFVVDTVTKVPEPVSFKLWLFNHRKELDAKGTYMIGGENERGESKVIVFGGGEQSAGPYPVETFLWQFEGSVRIEAVLTGESKTFDLQEGSMINFPFGTSWKAIRSADSVGVMIQIWPKN